MSARRKVGPSRAPAKHKDRGRTHTNNQRTLVPVARIPQPAPGKSCTFCQCDQHFTLPLLCQNCDGVTVRRRDMRGSFFVFRSDVQYWSDANNRYRNVRQTGPGERVVVRLARTAREPPTRTGERKTSSFSVNIQLPSHSHHKTTAYCEFGPG